MTDATPPAPMPTGLPAAIENLPLSLSVRIGTTRMPVREVAALGEGALLTLDARLDTPLEICIDDRVVALGELTEADGEGLAVKLIKMVSP